MSKILYNIQFARLYLKIYKLITKRTSCAVVYFMTMVSVKRPKRKC